MADSIALFLNVGLQLLKVIIPLFATKFVTVKGKNIIVTISTKV